MIAIDTETELIAVGDQIPRLVCVSFAKAEKANVVPWNDTKLGQAIADLLIVTVAEGGLIGHNIAYDLLVLARQFPDLLPLVFAAYDADRVTDTGLRAKLLDIADGRRTWVEDDTAPKGIRRAAYGLADLSSRYLHRHLAKDGVRLEFWQLRDVPFEQWPAAAVEYSRGDAVATYDVWQAQEARADELADQYRQARAELALKLASAWGLVPDPVAVAALAARVDKELDEHGTILRAAGLLRSDGTRAMDAVKARVVAAFGGFDAYGFDHVPRTDKGGVKTDRETCERTGDPVLATYAAYAKLLAVRRKDVPMLSAAPVIHTRFETLVETGRTASSDPNVQNLSRHGGVRECFHAREGNAYVVADYAGMELATLAQVCTTIVGKSALADVLRAGEDPHLRMASQILLRPYDELRTIYREHGPGYEEVYNARQTGKVANFGFPGGLGATRLVHFARQAYQVDLSEAEAQRLKVAWIRTFPEMAAYFSYVNQHEAVHQLGSGRVRAGASYTERCNSWFQGLGADMAKDALYRVARAQHVGTMCARTCNFVHDEIVVETPVELVDDTAREVEACMLAAAKHWLPDVPCGVEVHATRVYSKDAKRVVKDGRLVVWEPS